MPPYILIAVLWWLSGVSSDRARAEEAHDNTVQIAVFKYNQDVNNYERALLDRKRCIDTVEIRNNAITNWLELFAFLRSQGPEAAEFAQELENDFNSKESNRIREVEIDCVDFPEPTPPVVPRILIEEGLVDE